MRIKIEDLPAAINAALLAVRQGVQDARTAGLQLNLPDKVDFTNVEIIMSPAALSYVTTNREDGSRKTDASKPDAVETTIKTGGGSHTTDILDERGTRDITTDKRDESHSETNDTTYNRVITNEGVTDDQRVDSDKTTTEDQLTTVDRTQVDSGSSVQDSLTTKEYA